MALPLVTAWSYSRYADYAQCPAKFKYKHLEKRPDPGSAAMQRGNDIHKMAENFVAAKGSFVEAPGGGKLFQMPPELKNFAQQFKELREMGDSVHVEQSWGFKADWSWIGRPGWFGDDVWLRAKCDVAVVYEDDTADVIDHKTGKKYEVNRDQIELFAAASFRRFPNLKHIMTRLWYLDLAADNEVVEEFSAKDAVLIERDWNKRVQPMFNDRRFAPRPNSKCGWCPFSKAKGGPCKF